MYGEIDWFEIILAQKQTIERLNDRIEMLEAKVNCIAASKADQNDCSVEEIEKTITNYDLNRNRYYSQLISDFNEICQYVHTNQNRLEPNVNKLLEDYRNLNWRVSELERKFLKFVKP